jgi:hypothetical protein
VLAAVVLSQIAPVTDEAGRYLVSRLRPIAARLEALLAEARLVPAAGTGNLHHALGLTFTVIGEQAGDNETLERAVAAYRAALEEWTRQRVPLDWAKAQSSLGNALQMHRRNRSSKTGVFENAGYASPAESGLIFPNAPYRTRAYGAMARRERFVGTRCSSSQRENQSARNGYKATRLGA